MKQKQLSELIDLVYESVVESKVGKIIGPPFYKNEEGKIMIADHSYSLMVNLLCQLCPKGILSADMTVRDPKEDWQDSNG